MRVFRSIINHRKRTHSSRVENAATLGIPLVAVLGLIELIGFVLVVGADGGGVGYNDLGGYSVNLLSLSLTSNLGTFLVIYSALPHFAFAKSIRHGKEQVDNSTIPPVLPATQTQVNQSDPFAERMLEISTEDNNNNSSTTTSTTARSVDDETSTSQSQLTTSQEFEIALDTSADSTSLSTEVEKALKEFEKSRRNLEPEPGTYRLKRQMAQEIALIAPVLATAGCIPKFFCGMNSKPPSEKTSTLNDLAYLIKVAMVDDDDIDIGDDLFPNKRPHTRGKNDLSRIKDDLILENLAEEELVQEDPANIRWVSMDMENRIKSKIPNSKLRHDVDDELLDAIIVEPEQTAVGSLLTGIKSVFRIGRSAPIPEIFSKIALSGGSIFRNSSQVTPRNVRRKRATMRNSERSNKRWKKRPFWSTQQFRQDMELAERIGKEEQDDAKCSTTFSLCPYTTHEMMEIVHGGYAQKRRRMKKKKKPQWFMNSEGPPEDSSEEEVPEKKFKDPDGLITTTTERTKWSPNDPEQQIFYALFPHKAVERGVTTPAPPKKVVKLMTTTPMSITESEHEYEDLELGLREHRKPPIKIQGHVEYDNDDEASLENKDAEHLDIMINNKKRHPNQLLRPISWWQSGNRRTPPPPPPPHRGIANNNNNNGPPRGNLRNPERSEENKSSEDDDDLDEDDEEDEGEEENEDFDDTSSEEQEKKKPKKKKKKQKKNKKKESEAIDTRNAQENKKKQEPETKSIAQIPLIIVPTQAPTIPAHLLPQDLEYAQIFVVENSEVPASKQTIEEHYVQQLQPVIHTLPTQKPSPIALPRPKYKIQRVRPKKLKKKNKEVSTTTPQTTTTQPPTPPPEIEPPREAETRKPKEKKKKKQKETTSDEEEDDEESRENSSEERNQRERHKSRGPPPPPPNPIPPQNGRVILMGRPSEEIRDHRMNPHHPQNRPESGRHPDQMSAEENDDSGEDSNESTEMHRRPRPHHGRPSHHNGSHEYAYSDEMNGQQRPQLRPINYSYFKKDPRDPHNNPGHSQGGPPSGPSHEHSEPPPQTSTQKYSTGFLSFLFGSNNKDKNKRLPQQQQQQHQQHHNYHFPPGTFDDPAENDEENDDDDDDEDDLDDESNERQDTPTKTITSPEGELEVGHLKPPPKSIKPNFSRPQKPERPYRGATSMEDSDERRPRSTLPPPTSQQTSQPPRPLLFLGKPHRIIIPPPATPPQRVQTAPPTLPYSTISTQTPVAKSSDEEPESEEEKPSEESKEDDESKEDSSEEVKSSKKKTTTMAPSQQNSYESNGMPLPPEVNYNHGSSTTTTTTAAMPSSTTTIPTQTPSKKTKTRTDYASSDERHNDSNQTKEDDSEEEKPSHEIRSGEESNEENSSEEKKKNKKKVTRKPIRKPEDDELEHPSAQFPPQPPVVGDIAAVEQILGTVDDDATKGDDDDEEETPYQAPVDNIPAPPPLALQGFPTALEIVVPTNAPPIKPYPVKPGAPLAGTKYANAPHGTGTGPEAGATAAAAANPNQPGPGVPLAGFNQANQANNQASGFDSVLAGQTTGAGNRVRPGKPIRRPGGAQTLNTNPGQGAPPGQGGGAGPGPAAGGGGPSEGGSEQAIQAIRNPISTGNLGNRPGGNRRPGQGQNNQGSNNPPNNNRNPSNRNPQRGQENETENSSEEQISSEEQEKNETKENESSEENNQNNQRQPPEQTFDGFGFDESILSLGINENDDDDDDNGNLQKDTGSRDPPSPPPIFTGGNAQKQQAQHKPFIPRPITPATPIYYRPGFKNEPMQHHAPPPPPPPPPPPGYSNHHSSQHHHPLVLPMRPSAAASLTPFINKRPSGGPTSSFSVSNLLRPLMPKPVYKRKPLDPKVVQWIRETYGIPDLNNRNRPPPPPPPHMQPNRSGIQTSDNKHDSESESSKTDSKSESSKKQKVKRKERPTKKDSQNNKSNEKTTTPKPSWTTPDILIISRHSSSSSEKITRPVVPTPSFELKRITPAPSKATTSSNSTISTSTTTESSSTTTTPRQTTIKTTPSTTTTLITTTTTTKATTTSTVPTTSATTPSTTTTSSVSPPKPSTPSVKEEEIKAKHSLHFQTDEDDLDTLEAKMAQALFSSEESAEDGSFEESGETTGTKSKLKTKVGNTKLTITVKSVVKNDKSKTKGSSSKDKKSSMEKIKHSSSSSEKHESQGKRKPPSGNKGDNIDEESSGALILLRKSIITERPSQSSSRVKPVKTSPSSSTPSSTENQKGKKKPSSNSESTEIFRRKFTSSASEKKHSVEVIASSKGNKGKQRRPQHPSTTTPSPLIQKLDLDDLIAQFKKDTASFIRVRPTKKPKPQRIKLPPIYGKHFSRRKGVIK